MSTYPTWVKIEPGRWESEEAMGGTPDWIATRGRDGWTVKWRSSAQPTGGFRTIGEVKTYVEDQVREMDNRVRHL